MVQELVRGLVPELEKQLHTGLRISLLILLELLVEEELGFDIPG